MSKPRITFAQLRHLLLDMGFTETVTPKSHVFLRTNDPAPRQRYPFTDPIRLSCRTTSSPSASCWTARD